MNLYIYEADEEADTSGFESFLKIEYLYIRINIYSQSLENLPSLIPNLYVRLRLNR